MDNPTRLHPAWARPQPSTPLPVLPHGFSATVIKTLQVFPTDASDLQLHANRLFALMQDTRARIDTIKGFQEANQANHRAGLPTWTLEDYHRSESVRRLLTRQSVWLQELYGRANKAMKHAHHLRDTAKPQATDPWGAFDADRTYAVHFMAAAQALLHPESYTLICDQATHRVAQAALQGKEATNHGNI